MSIGPGEFGEMLPDGTRQREETADVAPPSPTDITLPGSELPGIIGKFELKDVPRERYQLLISPLSLQVMRECVEEPSYMRTGHHLHIERLETRNELVDGSEYAKAAFGGFGPGSPEYDNNGPRLKIVIPDINSAVTWFDNAEIKPHNSYTKTSFSRHISGALHPGIDTVSIDLYKTRKGVGLISGAINTPSSALRPADVPERDELGRAIDVYSPAKKMLKDHLKTRLVEVYGDKISTDKDENEMLLHLGDEDYIVISRPYSDLSLNVGINGKYGDSTPVRYGSTEMPTTSRLKKELKILQEHFPTIVDIYADFFRKQLPPTIIKVEYGESSQEKGGNSLDANRMSQLRAELIVEPDEAEFKYIGGLDGTVEKLKHAALGFKRPEVFRSWGVTPPRGIFLQGPPGTGKTALAMAFAHETGATLLQVKGSVIKSLWHGDTERNIKGVFQIADELVEEGEQVVIFFDEIETLAPARGAMGTTGIDKNVTTELLQAMNQDRPGCIVIAASNIPAMVDPALLRSGRFSENIEVSVPNTEEREDILQKLITKFSAKAEGEQIFEEIDVCMLAGHSEGLTGADLEEAIRKVLFAKAVQTLKGTTRANLVKSSEIYQSVQDVIIQNDRKSENYL